MSKFSLSPPPQSIILQRGFPREDVQPASFGIESPPPVSLLEQSSPADSFQSSQTTTEPTSVTPEVSTPPATEQGWTKKQKIMASAGAAVALVGGLLVGGAMKNLPNTAEDLIKAAKKQGIVLVEKAKEEAETVVQTAQEVTQQATKATADTSSKVGPLSGFWQALKQQGEKAKTPAFGVVTGLTEGATLGAVVAAVPTISASIAAGTLALTAPAWGPVASIAGIGTGIALGARGIASRFAK
ncbi:MAG: hypothetical protein ACKO34_05050 [Vampirovibrionales bacterium]